LRDEQALQLLVLASREVNAALLITRAFGLRSAKDLDALPETGAERPGKGPASAIPAARR